MGKGGVGYWRVRAGSAQMEPIPVNEWPQKLLESAGITGNTASAGRQDGEGERVSRPKAKTLITLLVGAGVFMGLGAGWVLGSGLAPAWLQAATVIGLVMIALGMVGASARFGRGDGCRADRMDDVIG